MTGAGLPVEIVDAQRPAVALKLTARPELIATTEDVVSRAKTGAVQVIDARTAGEFLGNGVRAAETAAVLETLGFNKVKVHDSSWLGYAARLDAPAERETFFNVGAMNRRLASMQRKVDELERMLGELRSSHTMKAACPAGKVC